MKVIRTGVIGAGAIGSNHARILSSLPGSEFLGVADPDGATRERAMKATGAAGYGSMEELIAAGVEAVVLSVPTTRHHAAALSLIEAGVHVLIEKPIAATVAEAQEIIASAEARGVTVAVGHVERFNPAVQMLKAAIGDEIPIAISITRVGPYPPRIKDVGIVVDLGVHDIDLLSWLSGSEFQQVHPMVARTQGEHEDVALLQFRMENGAMGHIHSNWLTPFKQRSISVSTRTRMLECDMLLRNVVEYSDYRADGSFLSRHLSVPFAEPLKSELENFLNAVRNGGKPLVTAQDGLRALAVAQQCLQAS